MSWQLISVDKFYSVPYSKERTTSHILQKMFFVWFSAGVPKQITRQSTIAKLETSHFEEVSFQIIFNI